MAWRKKALKKRAGAYWLLERGSRDNLDRLTLGYVPEAEAESARLALNEAAKTPWVRTVEGGQRIETRWSVADFIVYLWTHGTPPITAPDLEVEGLDLPKPTVDLEETRRAIKGLLVSERLDVERLLGSSAPTTPPRLLTVKEYYDTHYAEWRKGHRPKTWRTEAGLWHRILRPHPEGIGDILLGDVDEHLVADYVDGLTIERARKNEGVKVGDPASGATKRLHKAAITAMLKRAYRLKHIDAKPDLGVFTIEGSTKRVRKQVEPLSLSEAMAVLDKAPCPMRRGMYGCGIGTGMRPSELIQVDWSDIDWVAKTLAVRGEKTEQSSAVIPLTPFAFDALKTWWEAAGKPTQGIAFPRPVGRGKRLTNEPYTDGSGIKRGLATAVKAAGIARNITPYALRHSFATIAWEQGLDIDVARRIGRWADETMLRTVYARPRPGSFHGRLEGFSAPAPVEEVTSEVEVEVEENPWLALVGQ